MIASGENEMKKKIRVGILTSGGDAPGMNACVRAVVRGCLYKGMEVFGIYQGYHGLINDDIQQLNISSVADIIHRGGTILRTARSHSFKTEEGRQKAFENLKKHGISALVVIGGDGTMTGGMYLSKETGIKVYGLPGTIDNDLGYTDTTIGFDTAVNTAVAAVGNIRDTSSSMGRTTVIEVMGRACGDIALYAGLAGGAEDILIPEQAYDIDKIANEIKAGVARGKLHSIILKAEGVSLSTQALAEFLELKTGCETKTVLLGYIQRGGSPTARDRVLASRMGIKAAELIEAGAESSAIGIHGDDIISMPIEEALKIKKKSHTDFIEICNALL